MKPLPVKPQKISLYLDLEDIAWLEEQAKAAAASKSVIARQIIRAAKERTQATSGEAAEQQPERISA